MKKIFLTIAVAGLIGLSTSCSKCNQCTGASETEINHDYCNDIYRTTTAMDAAKETCETRGGTWTELK